MSEPARRTPRQRRCPICAKPLTEPGARFCSDRCTNVDLGRWLNGDYAIPVRVVEEDPNED